MSGGKPPVPVNPIRPIHQGDEIVVAVEGGYRRTHAPCDGFEVSTAGFLSLRDLETALVDFKLDQRKGRRR